MTRPLDGTSRPARFAGLPKPNSGMTRFKLSSRSKSVRCSQSTAIDAPREATFVLPVTAEEALSPRPLALSTIDDLVAHLHTRDLIADGVDVRMQKGAAVFGRVNDSRGDHASRKRVLRESRK